MDQVDEMQAEYANRTRRCLSNMDRDRKIPSLALIGFLAILPVPNVICLWSVLGDGHFPSLITWFATGFQISILSMYLSNWFYQVKGAKCSAMALGMLPEFEQKKYETPEGMLKDLNEICIHIERSSACIMMPIYYTMGWRRRLAMVGAVTSIFLMFVSSFCPDGYGLEAASCMIFGFFAWKALNIIMTPSLQSS